MPGSVMVINVLQRGLLLRPSHKDRPNMSGSDLTFRLSVLLQLQPTPTQMPVLALKTDEHHVSKRDVHKNQLAPPTNLVRR